MSKHKSIIYSSAIAILLTAGSFAVPGTMLADLRVDDRIESRVDRREDRRENVGDGV